MSISVRLQNSYGAHVSFPQGEDLDSAFDSISAFSSKKDNQEAVFGSEETILDIRYAWNFQILKYCYIYIVVVIEWVQILVGTDF